VKLSDSLLGDMLTLFTSLFCFLPEIGIVLGAITGFMGECISVILGTRGVSFRAGGLLFEDRFNDDFELITSFLS
jgi:hypothetical protein